MRQLLVQFIYVPGKWERLCYSRIYQHLHWLHECGFGCAVCSILHWASLRKSSDKYTYYI